VKSGAYGRWVSETNWIRWREQEGDDLHFQDSQYVEAQPLGLPDDGCKLKRCVEETVGMNETEISRRQSELHEKTWGREVRDAKGRSGKGDY